MSDAIISRKLGDVRSLTKSMQRKGTLVSMWPDKDIGDLKEDTELWEVEKLIEYAGTIQWKVVGYSVISVDKHKANKRAARDRKYEAERKAQKKWWIKYEADAKHEEEQDALRQFNKWQNRFNRFLHRLIFKTQPQLPEAKVVSSD